MISLILFTVAAAGFETTLSESGEEVRWREFPIEWAVSLQDAPEALEADEWVDLIVASFDTWEAIEETKLAFTEVALEMNAGSVPDGENTVWFQAEWDQDPEIGAVASVWIDHNTIIGFDIRINAETIDWSTDGWGTDAQAALTHEIGHALGLGHSRFEIATMYFQLAGDDIMRRRLDEDDERAISHLYSNRILGVPKFLSCNTSAASWGPWGLIGLLILGRRNQQKDTP